MCCDMIQVAMRLFPTVRNVYNFSAQLQDGLEVDLRDIVLLVLTVNEDIRPQSLDLHPRRAFESLLVNLDTSETVCGCYHHSISQLWSAVSIHTYAQADNWMRQPLQVRSILKLINLATWHFNTGNENIGNSAISTFFKSIWLRMRVIASWFDFLFGVYYSQLGISCKMMWSPLKEVDNSNVKLTCSYLWRVYELPLQVWLQYTDSLILT